VTPRFFVAALLYFAGDNALTSLSAGIAHNVHDLARLDLIAACPQACAMRVSS
jgi:hypothetical protein